MKNSIIGKNKLLQNISKQLGYVKVDGDINSPKKQDAKYMNSEVEKLNYEKLSMSIRNY